MHITFTDVTLTYEENSMGAGGTQFGALFLFGAGSDFPIGNGSSLFIDARYTIGFFSTPNTNSGYISIRAGFRLGI